MCSFFFVKFQGFQEMNVCEFSFKKNCSTFVGELYHTCSQIIVQLWADYKTIVGVCISTERGLWCASLLWHNDNKYYASESFNYLWRSKLFIDKFRNFVLIITNTFFTNICVYRYMLYLYYRYNIYLYICVYR